MPAELMVTPPAPAFMKALVSRLKFPSAMVPPVDEVMRKPIMERVPVSVVVPAVLRV